MDKNEIDKAIETFEYHLSMNNTISDANCDCRYCKASRLAIKAFRQLNEISEWAHWSSSETDSIQYARAQADVQKILKEGLRYV